MYSHSSDPADIENPVFLVEKIVKKIIKNSKKGMWDTGRPNKLQRVKVENSKNGKTQNFWKIICQFSPI